MLTNPPPAAAKRRPASQKNFLYNSDLLTPPKILLKGKESFSARLRVNARAAGFNADEAKQKLFLREEKDLLCLGSCLKTARIWYPPRRRVREECAADFRRLFCG
jgi:hypothetical protein